MRDSQTPVTSYEDLKKALKNRTGRVVVRQASRPGISGEGPSASALAAAERARWDAGISYSALLFTPEYTRMMLESGEEDQADTMMTITVEQARELLSMDAEWDGMELLKP
jgi:hypothetical protein